MKKIRLGIVGCGIAARDLHYPALKELTDKFEITAVTSRTKKHAEEFARLVGNPVIFNSYDELLESDIVDAVDLTIPIELNLPFIEKAVKKGKHVICEKPISTDVNTGKKVVEISKQTDRVIYIAENWRHIKKFYLIRDLLNKIKNPLFFKWNLWIGMDEENKYAKTKWRQQPKHIGGFLSDGGVHHVAAMRLIFGEIKWVSANTKKVVDYLGGPDFLTSIFEFENGVIGNYTVSYGISGQEDFEIVGIDNRLKLTENKIIVDDKEFSFEENLGYKEEFEDFYEVVINKKKNDLGSPLEALKDLAFFEAAVKSCGNKIELKTLL